MNLLFTLIIETVTISKNNFKDNVQVQIESGSNILKTLSLKIKLKINTFKIRNKEKGLKKTFFVNIEIM